MRQTLWPVWPCKQNQDQQPKPEESTPEAVILVMTGPEPRIKVPPYCFCWKLSWVLWLAMVQRGSSEQNHSQREEDFGILVQFRLDLQPKKMSKSIWEMKDQSSMTLGFCKGEAGKPAMLQNPS